MEILTVVLAALFIIFSPGAVAIWIGYDIAKNRKRKKK